MVGFPSFRDRVAVGYQSRGFAGVSVLVVGVFQVFGIGWLGVLNFSSLQLSEIVEQITGLLGVC